MLGGTWRTVGSRVPGNCSSAKRYLQSTFLTPNNSPHIYRHRRASQRRTVVPKALDSAKESDQGMQSDMGAEGALNGEEEVDTVKGRSQSAAARACSQAVDGLDKLLGADQQQSQSPHRRKALRAIDLAGSPYLLLTSALLFLFIAWDVFGGSLSPPLRSFYLLPHYVDWPVHAWVKGTFDPMLREMAAEKVVSNLPIFLGSSGWLACAITAIAQNPARGSRSVGIGVVALWSISGVGSGRNDVLVVDIIKHFFRRVRPSDINKSYAFPSGHTTSAVFILGTLLFVILPLCVAGPAGDTEGGDLTEREGRKLDRVVERIQDIAVPLWVLGGLMTACGRVFADVHWVSDTLAGACLGVFLTGAAANLGRALRSKRASTK